jgi:hypothetical protein
VLGVSKEACNSRGMNSRKTSVRIFVLLAATYLLFSQTGCPGLNLFGKSDTVSIYDLESITWFERTQLPAAANESAADLEKKFEAALDKTKMPLYQTTFKATAAKDSCHSYNYQATQDKAAQLKTEAVSRASSNPCDIGPDAIHVSQWILFTSNSAKRAFMNKLNLKE